MLLRYKNEVEFVGYHYLSNSVTWHLYTSWSYIRTGKNGSVKTPILTLAMDHTSDLRDSDWQTVLLTPSWQEEAEELSFRYHGICGSFSLAYPGGYLATSCNNELSWCFDAVHSHEESL